MRPKKLDLASADAADRSGEPGGNPFLLVGTILAAKIATIAVILISQWSSDAAGLVAATTWHWTLVVAALVAAPVAFAVRLRRVRARRASLVRAEWLLDDPPTASSVRATRRPTIGRVQPLGHRGGR